MGGEARKKRGKGAGRVGRSHCREKLEVDKSGRAACRGIRESKVIASLGFNKRSV